MEVFFSLQQQRFARQAQLESGQRQLLGAGALLLADPLQDFAEQGPFLVAAGGCLQAAGQFGAHPIQPVLVDGGVAGHLHLFDRFAHGPLETAQEAALAGSEKQDRVAAAASPPRPADPVHVRLGIKGDVVVDHQADAVHIETAGGHVGGHQHIHLAALEPFDGALPLGLRHVAVEHRHVVAVLLQRFGHGDGDRLGAGEDDHTFAGLSLEHPLQGGLFVGRMHHQEALTDTAGIGSLLLDRDLSGRVEIFLRNPPDFGRHGG